ncbi:DUF962 domain-containing protein [Pseudidiomarina taiwanensis]|uniref:DUF962 domain-containing protein n=1 Tax=Pseudidiomarina taiwanensis TaxID=337250 RepID=A0A432ZNM9_9GAMM|nr:DUF962 domain-containing protein [Pseudidiomarina taiwanensis]RUO79499.1 DUF962 domain-containing protein [Pseudidiomarina taiwanensis]
MEFDNFKSFYPYYLKEHADRRSRAMHYVGSSLVLALIAYAASTQQWIWLWLIPLVGYGFAWVGHFAFEHNKPATFKYPLYSLAGDWVMYKDFWLGLFTGRNRIEAIIAQQGGDKAAS